MPTRIPTVPRICGVCSEQFLAFRSEVARGGGLYCSNACYHKSKQRTFASRFLAKVTKTESCWIWLAAKRHGGYGVITINDGKKWKPVVAHRVSWEMHNGPIPKGLYVLHKCDVPACVRPDHLFLGSLKDNTQDMLAKKRHIRKLSDSQVADLRIQYADGRHSQTDLSKAFGIGQSTISRIVRNKNTY